MSLLDILCLLALIYCAVLAFILRRHARQAEWWAGQNERKYLQLFEDVPLACQETDLEGVIRRVNQKLCDLRGLQPSHILGKHYADFAAESERERVREITRRKLAGDLAPASQKQTYLREDGESVTVQVYETLLRDEKADIVGLRSAALDVTEHLRKEEEIWQTTAELRAIFQALPDLFLRLNTEGFILDYRGPKLSGLLGSGQEFPGRRIHDLVPPEAGRHIKKAIARLRKSNSTLAF